MGKKLKIVIAEDGTELGKSCEKALKSYGMDVIMCDKSGTQLLEKIKSEKPDVVLADIFMQNLDILGVLDAIHKTDAASRPMVMAMSSFDNGGKDNPSFGLAERNFAGCGKGQCGNRPRA